jgi:hypothetical protein
MSMSVVVVAVVLVVAVTGNFKTATVTRMGARSTPSGVGRAFQTSPPITKSISALLESLVVTLVLSVLLRLALLDLLSLSLL